MRTREEILKAIEKIEKKANSTSESRDSHLGMTESCVASALRWVLGEEQIWPDTVKTQKYTGAKNPERYAEEIFDSVMGS